MSRTLIKTMRHGINMPRETVAVSPTSQYRSLDKACCGSLLKLARLVRAQSEERIHMLFNIVQKYLVETPLLLIDEDDSVAFVFVDHVHKREQIRLTPSHFNPAMRQVYHRQVDTQFIDFYEVLSRE